MKLSQEEANQYHRHLILDEVGVAGQLKLKTAKVLVIGAGGLGCPILQYLAAAGVGTLGIIDDDVVAISNLQRQILYSTDTVGQPKVDVAKKRLEALNPHVNIIAHNTRLTRDNALEIIREYDIVVDGSDNFATRYLVNDACVLADKPLVFGSIFKFDGQVTVFNYQNGPTYRCIYPNPPAEDTVPNCSEIGVLGVLPGIIGGLQASETLKIILGLGTVLSGTLLQIDVLSGKQLKLNFKRNPEINITELLPSYEAFCGISSSVQELTWAKVQENPSYYNLLDVRTPEEREAHHLGGLHIPLSDLNTQWNRIPISENLVVYCQSGKRSAKAIHVLKEHLKETTLYSLKGGVNATL
ncbi:molybdopterin-synthase adenylyltransferase MoeB [Flavobacterium sp. ASW18X]|uniref:molybdopterin-synthase adenylyltransferase MoeB n=1 Tax=Flavobacterium sp. ASW18X TaxID=2572595 RepID=UPI0010ADD1C0|nr:molybdopterin-synthase adenylyltransferase MoeB [Flavobacterium sp. ASW18X]TKD66265.1 molybdopterin-synthase adenylyltransferase MoeB [Flavobacterium sp. ASW18X]